MPIVTTLKYDRKDLEKLVLSEAVDGGAWCAPEVGMVSSEGIAVRQVGVVLRKDLAWIVEATAPQAEGQSAEVVMLGTKGMRVELTPKAEPAEEA